MNTITNYAQLLAEGNLGSQNVDFYNSYGSLVSNSVALDTVSYIDQDTYEHFKTYGSKANYVERNRRINGAYGPAYNQQCNWLNPTNHFNLNTEDKCYYLQDYVGNGRYAGLFINGLTLMTRDRPRVYYQYYNSSFFDDPNSYYRLDVLGNAYPYSHGGKKTDIVIQQFSNYRVSDKLYLTFNEATGHPYHSEYQILIPITAMLFNDKLYNPGDAPPVDDPGEEPYNPVDPVEDPVDDPYGNPSIEQPPVYVPPESPYVNFGGDTTDTGPTANIDQPINPYFGERNPRYVEQYFPSLGRWSRWFTWY